VAVECAVREVGGDGVMQVETVGCYELLEHIGQGSASTVYVGRHVGTGEYVRTSCL